MANREIVMLDEQYPSNSHKSKQRKEKDEVVVEKVVQSRVSKKKKPFLARLKDDFGGEDSRTIGDYILYDVLIPAIKDTLYDIVKGGTERALFGETRPRDNIERDRGRSYVSYSRYYKDRDRPRDRRSGGKRPRKPDLDDVFFENRGEAERVLDRLVGIIGDYGVVSVYDLYSLCDITGDYTDRKWGWDDITEMMYSDIVRTRDGYLLELPKPEVI